MNLPTVSTKDLTVSKKCLSNFVSEHWAVIWGGVQNVWGGGKRTRERALPENVWTPPKKLLVCSVVDFLYRKKKKH